MVKSNPQRDPEEPGRERVVAALAVLVEDLARRAEAVRLYPDLVPLAREISGRAAAGDAEGVEEAVTRAYCYLHGKDRGYTPEERREFDRLGGYWCHAGGLSPLVRAAPYIGPGTRSVDYGAGNGLQGLLFQYLYPHRETVQVEISGPMIARGRLLQEWMGIPAGRVTWRHASVLDVDPGGFDFVYLYRPVRPDGPGREFYRRLADGLEAAGHRVVVFSVADCLKEFLGPGFRVFHHDGHLTCFTNEGMHGARPRA